MIPACNEADTLGAALGTLLAQDYPALEILLVNDRSTDGTGDIVDRLAASDPRITALHVRELPQGWLGKVHALHVASERARGDWLLFTDADVHFAPGALRRAVAVARVHQLDHLTCVPNVTTHGCLQEITMSALRQCAPGPAASVGGPRPAK